MRFLMLNELYLNKNKLESLDEIIYLPSLQILQVQDNQLQTCYDTEYQISYIPNIQQIDLSDNRIQSFGTIINFIQRCNELKQINYLEIHFYLLKKYFNYIDISQLLNVHNQLKQIKLCQIRRIKNSQRIILWFSRAFIKRLQQLELESRFIKLIKQLNNNTQIMHKINGLEQRKITKIHPFTYTERFKIRQILNDLTFIKNNFQINIDVDKRKFRFQFKISEISLQSIIFVNQMDLQIQKKIKVLQIQIKVIDNCLISYQKLFGQEISINQTFQIKNNKKELFIFNLTIQKVWRRDRMKNIKFVDSELDDLGEIDDDFLKQDIDLNFDLRIPYSKFLNRAKINSEYQSNTSLNKQNQNSIEIISSNIKKPSNNTETQMRTSHLSGTQSQSQMGQSKQSEKKPKQITLPTIGENIKKIMRNWNWKDPAVVFTIA